MIKDLLTELNHPDAIARIRKAPALSPLITSFLGRLALLHGVPFQYLVPDELLLGPESLKFFHVDPDWIALLVSGALSVGQADQTRLIQNKAAAGNFMAEFVAEARAIRLREQAERKQAERRKTEKPDPEAAPIHKAPEATTTSGFSGFLLRSRLLFGWPGLEVKAFGSDGPLSVLRLERVAPDVLLGLMDGQITSLRITQPPEGLHFRAPAQAKGRARGVFDPAGLTGEAPGSAGLAAALITASLQFTLTLPDSA